MNCAELIDLLESKQEYLFTLIIGIFLVYKNTKKALLIDKAFLRLYHNEEQDFSFLITLVKKLDLVTFRHSNESDDCIVCSYDTFIGLPEVYELYELLGFSCSRQNLEPDKSKFVGFIQISLQTTSLNVSKVFYNKYNH